MSTNHHHNQRGRRAGHPAHETLGVPTIAALRNAVVVASRIEAKPLRQVEVELGLESS
ncbi:MAG TPA: hypothetical protein VNG12_18980 [Acidimicrobiales bacterium]|nr:hypothetical protein [Acidimicrobiales bacterium]